MLGSAAAPVTTSTSGPAAVAAAALWVGIAGITAALAATWPLIERAKAAGGINPLLQADWRRSGVILGWAVSVLIGAATITSAACALRCYSRRGSSSSSSSINSGAVSSSSSSSSSKRWVTLWAVKAAALVALILLTTAPGLHRRTPLFFGVGGCALAGLFVITALLWAAAPGRRTPGDCCLLEGYALFLCAAWLTCGLCTAPAFALDPGWQRDGTRDATALAHVVMLFWLTGWACTAAGHWLRRAELLSAAEPVAAAPKEFAERVMAGHGMAVKAE
ncbi:hypothetical protein HYH02_003908 [Chlamydomonas schloesseri]|uniref:Uncharacterized protein n=1 Tax=Chlamydomonas schloesseri TaxID=2026947 RepID=A0A835WP68_9CHLO|nr:hypothetical protein HYH02_003908 [Chlamydomonas schloesseri]|eukprot:KAG2451302.1 hypothetical protein HYH02_003908 [Chlamydomonas schloesseri]